MLYAECKTAQDQLDSERDRAMTALDRLIADRREALAARVAELEAALILAREALTHCNSDDEREREIAVTVASAALAKGQA